MTTALDLIKRSMRLLGVYATGEEPSADETRDGLQALNAMLESMANDNLLVYAKTLDSISLAGGVSSVTVGPSGAALTNRPVEVLSDTYIEMGGVSYPVDLLTDAQYQAIGDKASSGLPSGIWVQAGMPNVTVTFWPVPDQSMTLKLWSNKLIQSFGALTTPVSLPPGYERMLAFMLAIELAPEYQREPSAAVIRTASAARRKLKRTNAQIPVLDMPDGVPNPAFYVDIRTA